jgi:hypothetical protein
MKAMLPYHRVDKLEEDDGWSLLKNQVLNKTQSIFQNSF